MKEYKFEAIIKRSEIGKGGAYIEFPFDVEKEFGTKGRVKIICFFEDVEYKGSLVKMGTQCHIVGIKKEIRIKLNKDVNDKIKVRIYKDEAERTVSINPFLLTQLNFDKNLKQNYDKLSFTKRKEINSLLDGAKKKETLNKRLNKIIEELKNAIS